MKRWRRGRGQRKGEGREGGTVIMSPLSLTVLSSPTGDERLLVSEGMTILKTGDHPSSPSISLSIFHLSSVSFPLARTTRKRGRLPTRLCTHFRVLHCSFRREKGGETETDEKRNEIKDDEYSLVTSQPTRKSALIIQLVEI